MKRITIFIITALIITTILSSCGVDFYTGKRPIDYPNTRWVSQNPDIYFEVGKSGEITHAQITINGNIIELLCFFYIAEPIIAFHVISTSNLTEDLNSDTSLFTGKCNFNKDKLVVKIYNNSKGFLDDSIKEIIFLREDM